jgi:AcrR family transcriptional regulator
MARVDGTRARLIDAAEQLFAARGVDAVSLREITRASGAKNAVAVQYHFEDRAGVVRAILDKHAPDIAARRHAMLDQYEALGAPDVRFLSAALVRPLAAKLGDAEGGREFLQIYADLLNRPDPVITAESLENPSDSMYRWRQLLEPLLAEDAARLHRRFTALLYTAIELGRRARSGPHADDRLFTSYLVDVVTAILAAPVSDETRRLADERDRARARRQTARRRAS